LQCQAGCKRTLAQQQQQSAACDGWSLEPPQAYKVTLPIQQLATLRSLELSNLEVTAPADADGHHQHQQQQDNEQQDTEQQQHLQQQQQQQEQQQHGEPALQPLKVFLPILTPELSALTKLSLTDCRLNLKGLRSLKHLSSLSLKYTHTYRMVHAAGFLVQHSQNMAEVSLYLKPSMQPQPHLTSLELEGEVCTPAVLEACSSLPALQRLALAGKLNNEALADLPLGLTELEVVCWQGDSGTAGVTLTAEAAPRLRQLTALQVLSLHHVDMLHPVVLGRMQDLRSLTLRCSMIDKGYAEPALDVLTRLTKLQDLFLRVDALAAGAATPADMAALTSSSQLTRLDVVGLSDAQMDLLFPAEQQLPQLTEAFLDGALLLQEHHNTLARAAQCCPALTSMQLHAPDNGEDPAAVDAAPFGHGLPLFIGNLYPAELVWLIQSIAIQSMQPAVQSRLLRLNVDCNTTVAVTETVASFPDGRNVLLGLWILSLTVSITMCQA
jgi:hypothetical protein